MVKRKIIVTSKSQPEDDEKKPAQKRTKRILVVGSAAIACVGVGAYVGFRIYQNPREGSSLWMRKIFRDGTYNEAREKIRLKMIKGDKLASFYNDLLYRIDKNIISLNSNKNEPYIYPKHTSNGWYLTGDD